jgi:hypothetical protein
MTTSDRTKVKVVAGAGLCGAAIALSPNAAAVPLITGGYACVQGLAGDSAPPAAAGAPVVAEVCSPPAPTGAALSGGAGAVPITPGPVGAPAGAPVGAPVPAGAGAPVGAPVPAGAPVGAPVPAGAGAPVGAPVLPAGAGAPVGAPVLAGAPAPEGALVTDLAGGFGGKGVPTGSAPNGGPVSGQPILPGPPE